MSKKRPLPHYESLSKSFSCEVREPAYHKGVHELRTTNNGFQWFGVFIYSIENLEELHNAIGDYIAQIKTPSEEGAGDSDDGESE